MTWQVGWPAACYIFPIEAPEERCIRQARELAAAQARIASLEEANRLLEQKLDHLI